jgi:hypothetical protein
MNTTKPSSETGRGRRAFVAAVLATAMAAVTGGVALNGRHPPAPAGAAAEAAAGATPGIEASRSDPSLPAASEVLERVPAENGEPAPTF